MCDIQYEEFDNKESIFQELRNMMIEDANEKRSLENDPIFAEISKILLEQKEITELPNIEQPIRMSELYSNFSSTLKTKLKSREALINTSIISNFTNNSKIEDDESSDISDIDTDLSNREADILENSLLSEKIIFDPNSCNFIDIYHNELKPGFIMPIPTTTVTTSVGCNFEDDQDVEKSSTNLASKPIVNSSSSCNYEDDNVETELKSKCIQKQIPARKIMVETSCDSLSDSTFHHRKSVNKNSTSRNVALSSFGSHFDENEHTPPKKQETTTTSTETDTCEKTIPTQVNSTNQVNEVYNSLEEKILPFIRNPNTVELKLKGRVSAFQTACVKQIASQHKLMMKSFGKGRDGYILLRKKIELLDSQKQFLEMKKAKLQKQKEQVATIKAKQERISNPPKTVSSGCQVDFLTEEKEALSKKAARRNRKKQWELREKDKLKKNSSTQTIEKGFYVCPYCEDDIPESIQFIHYPHCLDKYRSKHHLLLKSGKLSHPFNSIRPASNQRKNRSKSRDKINQSKIDHLKKELDKVDDNDINSIINIVTEFEKKCSISGCNNRKNKICSACSDEYCNDHFAPGDKESDKHFNCPATFELVETERQKKLGINNPLFKTIEQLSAPKFTDGVMIKSKKQVKVNAKPTETDPSNDENQTESSSSIIAPDINQTRTRNGPMFSFERNNLKRDLREKISLMVNKRSK